MFLAIYSLFRRILPLPFRGTFLDCIPNPQQQTHLPTVPMAPSGICQEDARLLGTGEGVHLLALAPACSLAQGVTLETDAVPVSGAGLPAEEAERGGPCLGKESYGAAGESRQPARGAPGSRGSGGSPTSPGSCPQHRPATGQGRCTSRWRTSAPRPAPRC